MLLLLAMVATHVRGPRRAVALFLIVYCLVSSITETGIGDASPYLLDLVVAASLLLSSDGADHSERPADRRGRVEPRRRSPRSRPSGPGTGVVPRGGTATPQG